MSHHDKDKEGRTEFASQRAVDDDTEGQELKPTEFASQRAVDDGTDMKPSGFASQKAIDDDEDTEGHSAKWS
jgi:hypothetical protein